MELRKWQTPSLTMPRHSVFIRSDLTISLDKKSADDKKYTCLSAVSKSLIQQGKLYGDQTTYGQALLDIGTTQEQLSILQTEYVI